MPNVQDPNFPTGSAGLVAIDKTGNKVLFLDPVTFETEVALTGFAPRVHELAISPDHRRAYAPIYGDGRHGHNPNPGHLIAILDLEARQHTGYIDLSSLRAPHGLRWGPGGQLYCVCEDSGIVVEIDAGTGKIQHVIEVGSTNAHRIEILPDGTKLYTENEEDPFAAVVDLQLRNTLNRYPCPTA